MCPNSHFFSVLYFLLCCFMHLVVQIIESTFDTALTSVFKIRELQAKTKEKTDIVNEFLFADYELNATTKANMQNSVDKFLMACDNFGLTISSKETEVLHQQAPEKPYIEPNITVKGQRLKATHSLSLSS